jgi:tRNA modification GTPase
MSSTNNSLIDNDTICAIATPSGQGGVGIVRISGPSSLTIASQLIGFEPTPRHAHYCKFKNNKGETIEQGIALFFAGPNSFTGEDVFELQGHGGSYSVQLMLKHVLACGARLANPGEFTERAFLNGKIDLVQAEAIADLIEASSQQAALSAVRTLTGEFSNRIHELVALLIAIRVEVEAAIDFSDEDIDLQTISTIVERTKHANKLLTNILGKAEQGALLKNGMSVAIAGHPNAGKSSLLNRLAGQDRAIVTDIPGTTRDLLSEQITIDGLPLNITDTAGLRVTQDPIEQEGVKRANTAVIEADRLLLVFDSAALSTPIEALISDLLNLTGLASQDIVQILSRTTLVLNKVDLVDRSSLASQCQINGISLPIILISAKHDLGIDDLREHLKSCVNFLSTGEDSFIARERHLKALKSAKKRLKFIEKEAGEHAQWDLLAEELRMAQQELNKITGNFTSDDLLGEIFSNFCVGK